jgi:formylglycine-generating enzyme required for sulfatase activity
MLSAVRRVLVFDSFALDLTRGGLRRGEEDIELRPKAFRVLCYLVENAGRLITKQELYEAVWADVVVSDDSIVQCIRELRCKLGDDDHRLIKTVPRRGYLLDAAVSQEATRCLSDGSPATSSGEPQAQIGIAQPIGRVPARKIGVWLAIAAGLLSGAAWWPTYHAGWQISVQGALSGYERHASFKDCEDCPDMVALPAGEFMMGSPATENGHQAVEGLPRLVVIPKGIAIGRFEVTVDQFSVFIAETGMTSAGNRCRAIVEFDHVVWGPAEASFRQPGFEAMGSQPVVCVSWYDAHAYAAWLQRRTGRPYRLPTEAEWEYAARAGTKTRYGFGDDETELCAYARFADLASRFGWHDACRSDTVIYGPLPVGSLKPNAWGIFDMHGNAWEWVADCWTSDASEIPTDGSAVRRPGGCEVGVVRGGSFAAGSRRVRSAIRASMVTALHNYNNGFRVALSLSD